jgi:hypothetical protein
VCLEGDHPAKFAFLALARAIARETGMAA